MEVLPHILLFGGMLHLQIQMPCHPGDIGQESSVALRICLRPPDAMTPGDELPSTPSQRPRWCHGCLGLLERSHQPNAPLFRAPLNTHVTLQFVLQRTLQGAIQHSRPPGTCVWVETQDGAGWQSTVGNRAAAPPALPGSADWQQQQRAVVAEGEVLQLRRKVQEAQQEAQRARDAAKAAAAERDQLRMR